MVAIGVIAVLTAIATPIYVNYTIKANVSSALPILEGLKTQISEYYTANGSFPTSFCTTSVTTGCINSSSYSDGKFIGGSSLSTSCPALTGVTGTVLGCAQVTFNNPNQSNYPLNGTVLSFIAIDGGSAIQWICSGGSGANSVPTIYLPKSCQNPTPP